MSIAVLTALLTASFWSAGAQTVFVTDEMVSEVKEVLSSKPRYAIEVTYGDGPLISRLSSQSDFSAFPSYSESHMMAENGQEGVRESVLFPTLSVNWVFIGERRTDIVLSARVSWSSYAVISHPVFGTDPRGNPRYKLTESTPEGRRTTSPAGTFTFSGRHTWASAGPVDFFIAFGGGCSVWPDFKSGGCRMDLFFTPLGIKIGHGHFYGLAEASLGICSPWCQGGLGWRF